jgi:chemotaxis family two-component system response regulator Rcp1
VARFRLLLVEDNEADVVLMQEVLHQVQLAHELTVAADGEVAMSALRDAKDLPDLVLLDLNMPRKDGREVLAEVKTDPALLQVPIVVLTTSEAPSDVTFAYTNHANAYVRKPNDLSQLTALAEGIRDFWERAATLPGSVALQ